MSGYTRTDTTNNIADGNVISAADLDNEFNGVQAAFNSSTGHTHDGSSAEGAPITKLGPVQDVTISTTVLGVKTTNTVDLGTSSLKFKDFYLAGNALIGGTLGVTGATTLSAALTYGGVTLSNAVTGTGNMVLSASPTLTGTITAAVANFSGAVALNGNVTLGDADTDTITQAASYVTGTQLKSAKTATNTLSLAAYDVDGTAYTNLITLTASNTPTLALTSTGVGTINNMSIGATTASTGAFTTLTSNGATTFTAGTASTTTGTGTLVITGGLGVSGRINAANFDGIVGANTAAAGSFTTLSANSTVTLSGGTENGVAYLNGSKVLTTGSALTFDGAILSANATRVIQVLRADNARGGSFYADNTGTHLVANADGADPLLLEALGAGDIRFRINSSEKMRLTSTGLGIGTSSPGAMLDLAANNTAGTALNVLRFTDTDGSATAPQELGKIEFYSSDASTPGAGVKASIVGIAEVGNPGGALTFNTDLLTGAPIERMRIDRFGNVGIGTSSPATRLHIADTAQPKITIEDTTNTSFGRITGGGSTGSLTLEADYTNTKAGTIMAFNVDNTERARIDTSGNLIQSAPTTAPTLSTNGTMVFNLTSNTNLRVSVRGSDGVTRTANLTLA